MAGHTFVFYFDIEYIKGENKSLPDILTREFLQGLKESLLGLLIIWTASRVSNKKAKE